MPKKSRIFRLFDYFVGIKIFDKKNNVLSWAQKERHRLLIFGPSRFCPVSLFSQLERAWEATVGLMPESAHPTLDQSKA